MTCRSLVNLFANVAVEPRDVRPAWALFEILVALLALFVLVVAIIAARRLLARHRPVERREPSTMPDPWEESARRIKPYDSTDQP
jgi:hypothetical protein